MSGKSYAIVSWVVIIAAYLIAGPVAGVIAFVIAFVAWFFVGRTTQSL